tara:strand:+ start:2074 stop:3348 length:1275 start_codon:yes stop_codon:yes gene_type:complete
MSDYQCMNCHKLWNDEFVKNNLTQANVKRLKEHRENVLLDREKAWMPETQSYVVQAIQREKLSDARRELRELQQVQFMLKDIKLRFSKHETLKSMRKEATELLPTYAKEIVEKRTQITELSRNTGEASSSSGGGYKSEHILKCPQDQCKGFVGVNMKCGLCSVLLCRHCYEIKNENHECDPEMVKNVSMIKESTKACPKCATRIHRVSGCSQMWCTQCNTSFDYRTGVIYTRNIHNPHYFEWLQRNIDHGREPEPVEPGCVDVNNMTLHSFTRSINDKLHKGVHNKTEIQNYWFPRISMICRLYYHARHLNAEYQYVTNYLDNPFRNYLDLRVQWMRNKITEEQFKIRLQRKEKQFNVDVRRHQVLSMLIEILQDICGNVLNSKFNADRWNSYINRSNSIMEYCDECFSKLTKMYHMKMPNIHI